VLHWIVMLSMTLMFPNLAKTAPPQFIDFALPFISSQWVNIKTSYLVDMLIILSPSLRQWKRHGHTTWPILNFIPSEIYLDQLQLKTLKYAHCLPYEVLALEWQTIPHGATNQCCRTIKTIVVKFCKPYSDSSLGMTIYPLVGVVSVT